MLGFLHRQHAVLRLDGVVLRHIPLLEVFDFPIARGYLAARRQHRRVARQRDRAQMVASRQRGCHLIGPRLHRHLVGSFRDGLVQLHRLVIGLNHDGPPRYRRLHEEGAKVVVVAVAFNPVPDLVRTGIGLHWGLRGKRPVCGKGVRHGAAFACAIGNQRMRLAVVEQLKSAGVGGDDGICLVNRQLARGVFDTVIAGHVGAACIDDLRRAWRDRRVRRSGRRVCRQRDALDAMPGNQARIVTGFGSGYPIGTVLDLAVQRNLLVFRRNRNRAGGYRSRRARLLAAIGIQCVVAVPSERKAIYRNGLVFSNVCIREGTRTTHSKLVAFHNAVERSIRAVERRVCRAVIYLRSRNTAYGDGPGDDLHDCLTSNEDGRLAA